MLDKLEREKAMSLKNYTIKINTKLVKYVDVKAKNSQEAIDIISFLVENTNKYLEIDSKNYDKKHSKYYVIDIEYLDKNIPKKNCINCLYKSKNKK